MDGTHDNNDPAQDAPTFHLYPRLPSELKFRIWSYYWYALDEWAKGAHRFRLFVNPEHPTRLAIEPSHKEVDDASAWRYRLRMACIDPWAYKEFRLIMKAKLKPLHRDQGLKQKFLGRPWFDPEEDLITFKFDYGDTVASLVMLDDDENLEIFRDIKRIGLEIELYRQGFKRTSRFQPFRCACGNGHAPQYGLCEESLFRFLRFFPSLEVVYIIFPVNRQWVVDWDKFKPQRLERWCPKSPSKRRSGQSQENLDAFRRVREIAQEYGLREFHNRAGIYCQFVGRRPGFHFRDGKNHVHFLHFSSALARQNHPDLAQKLKFEALAWCDLRGATVGTDGPPVRTKGPWR